MENASKALIMAGSILIGVLILGLFAYIFNTMGQYAASAEARREEVQVSMFNANFTKYIGTAKYKKDDGTEVEEVKVCSMHDVISCANLAKQNNETRGIPNESRSDYNHYVQVDFLNKHNIEKETDKKLLEMLKNNDYTYDTEVKDGVSSVILKKYKCRLEFANYTGRVNYVIFENY